MRVLVADDEPDLLNIVKLYLEQAGFSTVGALDGTAALEAFRTQSFDLAVLDWMMPGCSGIDLCREIKRCSSTKVLLLTAKSGGDDEVNALKAGADDYVRKPFDPRALVLRVKKILKLDEVLRCGALTIDLAGQTVCRDGMQLQLTRREYELLRYLAQHRGRILTRRQLLEQVWGIDFYGDERTLDTHIRRLRE